MSYLFTFVSLILINDIPRVFSTVPGLGVSSCVYFGSNDKKCSAPVVPAKDLPSECTSFIMDGLSVLDDKSIHFTRNEHYQGYLNDLLTVNKPVFLVYGRSLGDWNPILENAATLAAEEMKVLKPYLDKNCNGISGLILKDMIRLRDYDNNISSQANIFLETMRKALPGMAIGLTIDGEKFVNTCSNTLNCLDYSKIDKNIDFYLFNVINFNTCSEDFRCGTTPVSGAVFNTLDKAPGNLVAVNIPRNKVHILIRGSPTYSGWDPCLTTYEKLCVAPPVSDIYCADTQQSLIDKGMFTKKNLAGFIMENVDLMDPRSACKCDHPFPGFYFLLAGYNNAAKPAPCALFDSNCKNNVTK